MRTSAVLLVVVLIAPRAWAPPARPAPRPARSGRSIPHEGRGRVEIERGGRIGEYGETREAKPFEDLFREEQSYRLEPFEFDPIKAREKEAKKRAQREAVRKLLSNQPLTLEELALLRMLLWDARLSWDEQHIIRDKLDALKPRESPEHAAAREFHEQWLPSNDISIPIAPAPELLRGALAEDIKAIRETRAQMYSFHRGLDRLRRSKWNAEQALAAATVASQPAGQRGRSPRARRIYPHGYKPPPTPLPPEIMKLLPKDASPDWKRYAHRVLKGQDVATSLAYVDFLYAAALSGAKESATLLKLDVPHGPVSPNSEAAMLREVTRALVLDARIRTSKSVLSSLGELTRRLRNPPVHRFAAALPSDTIYLAFMRAAKEMVTLAKTPEWQRAAKLPSSAAGFTSSSKRIDFYLRDGDTLHLVRVDRKTGQPTLFLADQANAAFNKHCNAQLRAYSKPGFRLANVLRARGGYRVQMADVAVRLTNAEVNVLTDGKRLPDEHALSRALARDPSFVVYSHPLMAREGRYRADADRLAFAIQRSYPEVRVFKDDLSDKTESRARAVQQFVIDDPSDVLVLKAADSFNVDDANILNDVIDDLTQSGIHVKEVTDAVATSAERSRLVIVISGHIDANLAAFVRRAGEAGYFRNNIVAFNSCASELTSQLVHEMNTRYGAVATYRYEGKIPAVKVQDILLKLNDEIQNKPTLDDWKKFVLDEGLTGVWNICFFGPQEQHVG